MWIFFMCRCCYAISGWFQREKEGLLLSSFLFSGPTEKNMKKKLRDEKEGRENKDEKQKVTTQRRLSSPFSSFLPLSLCLFMESFSFLQGSPNPYGCPCMNNLLFPLIHACSTYMSTKTTRGEGSNTTTWENEGTKGQGKKPPPISD